MLSTGSNIRNSSVTPPPCILRKQRREHENNNNTLNWQKPVSVNRIDQPSSEAITENNAFEDLQRASSGSSLSTLTPDTYSQITAPNGQFLSLQRTKRKHPSTDVPINHGMHPFQAPSYYQNRPSASLHGSPMLNNGHRDDMSRPGCNSNKGSPRNTIGRNNVCPNGFHTERTMFLLKKEIESVSEETKQLDSDMGGIRQDLCSVQENIVSVKGSVDGAKDKMNRLQNHVNYVEKQVASIFQVGTVASVHIIIIIE